MSLSSGWVAYQSSLLLTQAVTNQKAAMEIVVSAFKISVMTNEYLYSHDVQSQQEWESEYESLSKSLKTIESPISEIQNLLNRMSTNNQNLRAVFTQLVASFSQEEVTTVQGLTAKSAVDQQIVNQLSTKLDDIVSDAVALQNITHSQLETAKAQTRLFTFIMIAILVFGLALGAWMFYSTISRPITELHHGTDVIAAGNLDYQVPAKGRDEIGQLSRAFNEMALHLKDSYASLETEVNQRKSAEENLRKINRAYRTLLECNQVMLRATDENQLLQEICRLIVETGSYRLAWIGFAEEYGRKIVRPVAQADYEAGYLEKANITWDKTERGRGPTGTAIRTGAPYVARNILTDPNYEPWRASAIQRGYVSVLALPLLSEGKAFGALTIYATEPDTFDTDEINLLEELAYDLVYGLTALRTRSERSKALEALRQERDKAQKYLNVAGVILVALNNKGEITLINRKGCDLLGYKEEKLIGRNWFDTCLPKRNREQVRLVFDRLMAGEVTLADAYENPVITKSGEERQIFWNNIVLQDEAGKIIGTLSSGEDITERQRAQAELIQKAEELAHSNAELEQFARITSHDMQEPLRKTMVFTGILESRYADRFDTKTRQYIARIVEGVNRMYNVVTDLQEYLLARGGDYPVTLTNFEAVLEQVLKNLEVQIQNNQAQITHDELPMIMANFSQMVLLLENLLDNAIKFHGPESPHIHVSAVQEDELWVFSVRDNGIGIDPKYIGQMFSIFQRLHGQDQYPGTGIGLAICKKIVERHNGRIWVESEVGQGSTFHFTLHK